MSKVKKFEEELSAWRKAVLELRQVFSRTMVEIDKTLSDIEEAKMRYKLCISEGDEDGMKSCLESIRKSKSQCEELVSSLLNIQIQIEPLEKQWHFVFKQNQGLIAEAAKEQKFWEDELQKRRGWGIGLSTEHDKLNNLNFDMQKAFQRFHNEINSEVEKVEAVK